MVQKLAPLPSPILPWTDSSGKPTQEFTRFMIAFAAGNFGPLVAAANDADAAKANVPIGQIYQASGVVRIRLA